MKTMRNIAKKTILPAVLAAATLVAPYVQAKPIVKSVSAQVAKDSKSGQDALSLDVLAEGTGTPFQSVQRIEIVNDSPGTGNYQQVLGSADTKDIKKANGGPITFTTPFTAQDRSLMKQLVVNAYDDPKLTEASKASVIVSLTGTPSGNLELKPASGTLYEPTYNPDEEVKYFKGFARVSPGRTPGVESDLGIICEQMWRGKTPYVEVRALVANEGDMAAVTGDTFGRYFVDGLERQKDGTYVSARGHAPVNQNYLTSLVNALNEKRQKEGKLAVTIDNVNFYLIAQQKAKMCSGIFIEKEKPVYLFLKSVLKDDDLKTLAEAEQHGQTPSAWVITTVAKGGEPSYNLAAKIQESGRTFVTKLTPEQAQLMMLYADEHCGIERSAAIDSYAEVSANGTYRRDVVPSKRIVNGKKVPFNKVRSAKGAALDLESRTMLGKGFYMPVLVDAQSLGGDYRRDTAHANVRAGYLVVPNLGLELGLASDAQRIDLPMKNGIHMEDARFFAGGSAGILLPYSSGQVVVDAEYMKGNARQSTLKGGKPLSSMRDADASLSRAALGLRQNLGKRFEGNLGVQYSKFTGLDADTALTQGSLGLTWYPMGDKHKLGVYGEGTIGDGKESDSYFWDAKAGAVYRFK